MQKVYIFDLDANVRVCEEYTLDIIVQEIFEKGLKECIYHYVGDEFVDNCYSYLKDLMSYYIKAKGTQLYEKDIIEFTQIIHEFYGDTNYVYKLRIMEVQDDDINFVENMIEEIGLDNFLAINKVKVAL